MTNISVLKGYAGQDAELKQTQSGTKVATYSLAVYRANPKDKNTPLTDWFTIVSWGDQAEAVARSVKKGTKLLLTGRFQTRSYENKEGKKVIVTEFFQDDFGIIPKKEDEDTGSIYSDQSLPF